VKRIAVVAISIALVSCGKQAPNAPVADAPAPTASQWPEADALFHRDPRWLGADAAYSIPLGGDRTLWLFQDSFVATSAANVRTESHMVHNTVAVQTGRDPTTASIAFAWSGGGGGGGEKPGSFFPEDEENHWYWPLEGIRIDGVLVIFQQRIRGTPGQNLGFADDGCRALLVANPDDDPHAWRTTKVDLDALPGMPRGIDLATAVVRQGDDVFMLAVAESNDHAGYLAKARAADLAAGNFGALAWWNGSAYVAGATPAKVMDNAGPENSLHFDSTSKKWVHVRTDGFGATTIVVSFADRIEGPWSSPRLVFRPPEDDREHISVYAAKAHPELVADGALVITYATNTLADFGTLVRDSSIYYPRFVKLRLGP
jgi:hypothetical protein